MSFIDYTIGRFREMEDLTVSARDNSMIGGGIYNITAKDKAINKLLKSKVRIVKWHNLLFVNCKGLKNGMYRLGAGYAMAYLGKDKKILFVSMPVGGKESFLVTGGGILFGAIGGVIASSFAFNGLVCYRLSYDSKSVKRLDAYDVGLLLFDHPELLKAYKNEKKKTSASVIIKYLKQSGYIEVEE